MPKRIQRKRENGWRLPPDTICVTRPSRFGNPYSVEKFGIDLALKLFANTARGIWSPALLANFSDEQFKYAYDLHKRFLQRLGNHPVGHIRFYLKGRDVACFCKEGEPCHGDILIEIANE